jgi:UDP-N-acetylmuramate dehydrogenase
VSGLADRQPATAGAGRERFGVSLAELTTLRLGGPARRLVEAASEEELVAAVASATGEREPLLVLAGGSNLVVADAGFAGTVVRVATRGVAMSDQGVSVRVEVAAGESWDGVVAGTVAEGLAGIECLAGIPGSAGATPIQNVGAYGQDVAGVLASVRAYDRHERAVVELSPRECGFAYRSSMLRATDRYVVLAVTLALERSPLACPIRYGELARALAVAPGGRAPLAQVREAVLALRRAKGMVVDPADPDSVSAGSFFVNPVLPAERFEALEARAAERLGAGARPPAWPEEDGSVKTSAAWLIERAGFRRGHGEGAIGISGKHTLALVNRGGGTTAELVALAREIRDRVEALFGVRLRPEPTLVGVEL